MTTNPPPSLRARIAAALRVHYHCPGDLDPEGPIPCACGWIDPGPDMTAETDFDAHMADVVLAVLRGLTLRELEQLHRPNTPPSRPEPKTPPADRAAELRRLAAETQQTQTETPTDPGACGHRSSDGHPCTEPTGHLGYHRNTRQNGTEWTSWAGDGPWGDDTEMCGAEPPEGWPGDCWCELPAGHEGDHRCQTCSTRHGAPGWAAAPAVPVEAAADDEEQGAEQ